MFSTTDASTIHPSFKSVPALVIPYVDPWTDDYITYGDADGSAHHFCRVRYYSPKTKVHGFKKKKQLRYTQPPDSGVHPYFPMCEDIDWLDIAEDTDVPIMITEGEKKALSACLAGIPTIGLGGVYNFTHDGDLLPILERIDWEDRVVYVCYDSDAADNNKIQVAEGRLATELSMKRGAEVFLVRLPKVGNGKTGVDDFIVSEGDEALFNLLENAPPMRSIDKEVLRLNGEVAWVEKEGLVLDLTTDMWMKKGDFTKGSQYSSRTVTTPNAKGDGVVVKSVTDLWLTHEHARRYADTIFKPGTTDKAVPLAGGGIAYNRFRGLAPVDGDVAPFFEFYDYMMSRTVEFDHDLIWKTICYKVQNLEETVGLGLILTGTQGGGKSLLADIFYRMFKPYSATLSTSQLGSDYNGWVETSLFVVMNEAKSAQLKYNMDKLKTYVTDKTQPMNEKYRANRDVDFHGFVTFTSNERSAGAFPDDDRRMIVLLCPDTHPDGDAFYAPVYHWRDNGGPKKLLNYFMNYDLKGWTPPRRAPETYEKRMAYHASLTPVQKLGHAIKDADENIVAQWIAQSLNWATSESVAPAQIQLASDIQNSLIHIQIRPFYTPEELALMFPAITSEMAFGKMRDATPANRLAQELMQIGVQYLRCSDNFDGFIHKGQVRQYLIISNADKYQEPITQQQFDRLMKTFPTYNDYRSAKRRSQRKRALTRD